MHDSINGFVHFFWEKIMYVLSAYKELLDGKKQFESKIPKFQDMYREKLSSLNSKYVQIMESTSGDPRYTEFKHPREDRWAFIVSEMSFPEEGAYRVQCFDRRGFFSHLTYKSLELAIEAMINDNFYLNDKGCLELISSTALWNRGVELGSVLQKSNSKMITWIEANKQSEQIIENYEEAIAAELNGDD